MRVYCARIARATIRCDNNDDDDDDARENSVDNDDDPLCKWPEGLYCSAAHTVCVCCGRSIELDQLAESQGFTRINQEAAAQEEVERLKNSEWNNTQVTQWLKKLLWE